jgi:hypothetical protein
MTAGKLSLCLVLFLPLLWNAGAIAKEIGSIGATYPIIERNGTDVLRERAAQIDWTSMFNKAGKEALGKRPDDVRDLPRAKVPAKRIVDMTYTLDMDVPDFKDPSKVLYPKGYKFNPLEYMPDFRQTFVFINATDKKQIAWFKTSRYADDDNVNLFITAGDIVPTIKAVKVRVYYADGRIIDRFGVKAVPSVVRQAGNDMEVEEFAVSQKNK